MVQKKMSVANKMFNDVMVQWYNDLMQKCDNELKVLKVCKVESLMI